MKHTEHRFLIGRARECDVVLSDPSVSRRHAELVFTLQGRWLLVDRRSHNGTSVGAGDRLRPVTQEIITPTDTLQFGDVRMSASELLNILKAKVLPAPGPAPAKGPEAAPAEPIHAPGLRPPAAPVAGARAPGGPNGNAAVVPLAPVPAGKAWVHARRLTRCACGAVKPKGGPCPECRE